MSDQCALCSPDLEAIAESAHWRLVLNRNQNLLGKCMLVLRRHLENVPDLTIEEWADLHPQVRGTHAALVTAFAPDHFNFAFLQNQDRHVHLHVIPRYATPRAFAGVTFDDVDYPEHYRVPGSTHILDEVQMDLLSQEISRHLARDT